MSYGLRELMVEGASGEFEATSHLQINWRRVKRKYFEVYFFRSAVTANSKVRVLVLPPLLSLPSAMLTICDTICLLRLELTAVSPGCGKPPLLQRFLPFVPSLSW